MSRTIFLLLIFITQSFAQDFRFVVFGDSQFQNPEVFEAFTKKAELLKPDIYLHVGDMIHGYSYNIDNARRQWKRFNEQIENLSAPFYPTPGNHDITTKEIEPAYVENWGKDKLNYSFDYKNSHFIILNTGEDQKFDKLTDEQVDWLIDDLENSNNAENIFISMHSPLHLGHKFNWDSVHNIIKKYPIRAIFSGHYHTFDQRTIDGIRYINLTSSGNLPYENHLAGRSHNFLFITVADDSVEIAVINKNNIYDVEDVAPDEYKLSAKYFSSNQTAIISNPSVKGIDTALQIPIKNTADKKRVFTLVWQSENDKWDFNPQMKNLEIDAEKSDTVGFNISGLKGNFNRTELPKLKVSSDYLSNSGVVTKSEYFINLFYPPKVFAAEINDEIKLDGKLDEEKWEKTEGIKNLFVDKENHSAKENTSVKILYDDKNLYVGIKGEEPNPAGLSEKAYGDIPLVFADDDFEIFFDANRDLKTFYRLMVNPAGTTLSSSPEGRFTFDFDVETFTGEDFWSAEFKIPFSEMDEEKPETGERWGFNVRRHRQQADIVQSDWSKMQNYPPYQPEYFGILIFKK